MTHPETSPETNETSGSDYLATVTDTISKRRIGSFTFTAASVEDAREQAWRTAGKYYCPDIHVRVTPLMA